MMPEVLSLATARRMALAAQGFARPRPRRGVTRAHLRRILRLVGAIQIDSVSVLVPAHYQVPFSRLGPYDRALLDDLVYRRREFIEQWAHEASILPVEHWPLLRHRMEAHDRSLGVHGGFLERNGGHARRVLEEVRRRGPLAAAEVPEPDGSRGRSRGWWGWSISKATFEGLFARGALAIAERRKVGFTRVYDLAERVIPPEHRRGVRVGRVAAQRRLLRLAARAHGVGTAADLADYYRIPIGEARHCIKGMIGAGELLEARVEGWREPVFLLPGACRPRRIEAAALLSPFDPLIWHRPRTARLFGFDYRMEIYTPRARRRWGYYVLPFLLGERLVARVDLKADRAAGRLLVAGAHLEAGQDSGMVSAALARELQTTARWLALGRIAIRRRGGFAPALAAATTEPQVSRIETMGYRLPGRRPGPVLRERE
jgi:uncharacterized protein